MICFEKKFYYCIFLFVFFFKAWSHNAHCECLVVEWFYINLCKRSYDVLIQRK